VRLGAKQHDEVRAVFEAEYARLSAWCAALAGSQELGEELAAEAFSRLLANWSRVEKPRAFLYTVASNALNDVWRRQARRRRLLRLLAVSSSDVEPGPDNSIRDLIARLPERQRIAVLLHYYAQLPLREVAHQMDRPEGSVRRWIAEARAALRVQIEEVR
jgi:RNA polymerase sigma-70 factor (ECF subfamily)